MLGFLFSHYKSRFHWIRTSTLSQMFTYMSTWSTKRSFFIWINFTVIFGMGNLENELRKVNREFIGMYLLLIDKTFVITWRLNSMLKSQCFSMKGLEIIWTQGHNKCKLFLLLLMRIPCTGWIKLISLQRLGCSSFNLEPLSPLAPLDAFTWKAGNHSNPATFTKPCITGGIIA